jgi:uncharacterized membrane protein YdjX (TVP38/TMEM64 family)
MAWVSFVLQRVTYLKRFFLAFILGLLIIAAFILKSQGVVTPESILSVLQIHPVLTPIFFLVLFALMSLLLLPTLPLNLLSGFLWGPYWGTFLSVTGATAGAMGAFLFSRYLAKDFCQRKFQNPAWSRLQLEVGRQGWKAVAFVRVNSIFPSGPLNYYFGITPVPFHTFTWASVLFFIPPAFLVASIGHWMGWSALTGGAKDLIHAFVIISALITLTVVGMVILKNWLQK